jgi:pyrroloquinoline quinone biosynthesis protein D
MSGRVVIGDASQPALKRGARRHFDAVRNQHILQGPERIIVLDDIACAILDLCDGSQTVQAIAATLAARYQGDAAAIEADVTALLQELADKGLLAA